jgi:hypothetical protein
MAISAGGRAREHSRWMFFDRFIPGHAQLVKRVKLHDRGTMGHINRRGALLLCPPGLARRAAKTVNGRFIAAPPRAAPPRR